MEMPEFKKVIGAVITSAEGRRCPKVWRLYVICRRADMKLYIGITSRTVACRFRAHCADAMRNGGTRGRPGTITHAIREAIQAGIRPEHAFYAREVSTMEDQTRRAGPKQLGFGGSAQPGLLVSIFNPAAPLLAVSRMQSQLLSRVKSTGFGDFLASPPQLLHATPV